MSFIRRTWEFELRANLARVQALDRSISSRKKGSASLDRGKGEKKKKKKTHLCLSWEFKLLNQHSEHIKSPSCDWLEACELFAEEVNDYDAEHEAGERGEESGDACNWDTHRVTIAQVKWNVHESYNRKAVEKCRAGDTHTPSMYLEPSCLRFLNCT